MVVINRRIVRILLFSVLLLLIGAYLIGPRIGVASLFKLDEQGTIAVWFEAGLYFLAAILLSVVALSKRDGVDRTSWRWGVFALLMLFLSLSAEAEINKKIVDHLSGWVWWFGWEVVELTIFILLAGFLLWALGPVLAGMPPRIRRGFWVAGVVFVCGALVVDNLAEILFRGGSVGMYLLEEGLEFSGLILLVDAILGYLSQDGGQITMRFIPDEENARD